MPTNPESYPRTAYLISLIGGILLLVFTIVTAILLWVVASIDGLGGFDLVGQFALGLAVLGILFGLIVIFLAWRLKTNPASAKVTGIVILVLGLVSVIGGGGFYIGAILTIVGGILAMTWHPAAPRAG